jgi:pSer/pThr/pTyr-binding forkhead associated (FHA) protein
MSAAAGTTTRVDFGLIGSVTFDQTQDKTWGVGNLSESYKQAHIIDLSVRIYQGHDSSSTVYDPRYFAVHHFNPGVEFLNDAYRGTGAIPVNALGAFYRSSRNFLQEDFKDLKGSNGTILNSVKYNYQQASGVDFKIPSRYRTVAHQNDGQYTPASLSNGTFVFFDATYATNPKDKLPPIMSEKYWNVETRRTGKLLPYNYEVLTLTIPADVGGSVAMINKSESGNETVYDVKDKLIVKNFGTGYNTGDTVGIQALNIELKVLTVDVNGSILTLLVLNNGENLPPSFCMDSKFTIKNLPENPPFKVTTLLSSAGKGFEAYFVCSRVTGKIKCDPKPLLIKTGGDTGAEIVRIAANVAGPTHDIRGLSATAESKSYVNVPGGATFNLTDKVKSADSTYDIFFHFHNDITMTWLACGAVQGENGQPHGDSNNPTESEEQHVTIESIKLT